MRHDADVAVVGAGPAGSAAAIILASRGLRAILVDRACFPRAKVCGDGLTPRALAALERLGAWKEIEPRAQVIESIRTLDLRTGAMWSGPIPSRVSSWGERGAVVRRDVLDDILRQRAVRAGAVFQGGTEVTRIDDRGSAGCVLSGVVGGRRWECSSRVAIVADGAGGRLGAHVCSSSGSLLEGVAVRQYWRVPSVVPMFTICVPLGAPERSYAGYGWIFPVSADIVNVGVGLYDVRDGRELRRAYDHFISRLCEVDRAWRTAVPCGTAKGGLLRSGGTLTDSVQGHIVLAGEAAGVTNPFTGEGIAQALDCGEIAALAALEDFESPGRLASALIGRMRETFPQTTRLAPHLPWLIARAEGFVPEFWGAVSPPIGIIGRSARSVALEEQLREGTRSSNEAVARTWTQIGALIGEEFPLLAQLLDAVRSECEVSIDGPLQEYWEDCEQCGIRRCPEIDEIAQLLCLATLMCVIAGETCSKESLPVESAPSEAAVWAVNAVALGAADILMATFFTLASRISPLLSAGCSSALLHAFAALCGRALEATDGREAMENLLHGLAADFKLAARTCVARAA